MERRRTRGAVASPRLPALSPDDDIPYIVGRVAKAYHRSWEEVYDDYWHLTLLALYALEEVERIEGLEQEHRDLTMAFRFKYDGRQLMDEQHAFRTRLLRGDEDGAAGMTPDQLLTFPGMPGYKKPLVS
jgi:hypothetical protein